MVLGKLPVPGHPTVWMIVGPTVLAVGAGGGCLDIFTLLCLYSPLSPSLWETARYRLKYCLKGLLNTKQPTNQNYWVPCSYYATSQCNWYFIKVNSPSHRYDISRQLRNYTAMNAWCVLCGREKKMSLSFCLDRQDTHRITACFLATLKIIVLLIVKLTNTLIFADSW